ncbi:MAG TPA: hypothetical protein VL475_16180 [Planctomycetaceae bacterium]|nr:hypothetical protein [Planctomycetaceae bacterium]
MKQMIWVAALATALSTSDAWAQGARGAKPPEKPAPAGRAAATDQGAGHTAPKQQPNTAPDPAVPGGELALGTVTLRKAVKADGKPLPAGTYQVRLTAQAATGDAKGATATAERWVDFLRGGKVVGREVVTIVPQSEIAQVQKDTPPARNGAKVETLKGGDYVRVWINRGGNHYLIHLPANA